jgi:uncharacterized membrane protein
LSYREFKAIFGFGLLLGVGTLLMALTSTGGEVDVYTPILIIVGSTVGLLFSFRKGRTTERGKIALVVFAMVLLALVLIGLVVIPSQNPMQKALESCEKSATTGTYTVTTFITTQVSGTNTTTSFATVTTQRQICTISP